MQLLCGALPASRRNEALVISRNHCLVLPGQVKLAFRVQHVYVAKTREKFWLSHSSQWLPAIKLVCAPESIAYVR